MQADAGNWGLYMWWLWGFLRGRKRHDFPWVYLLHTSDEHFQTKMPQLQKCSRHLHSARAAVPPQWEAIDYAVTSDKLSPPKSAFWRRYLFDQTVPAQITVNPNEFSLNEHGTAWHRNIRFFSNCLDKVEKHHQIWQQPQQQTENFTGTC